MVTELEVRNQVFDVLRNQKSINDLQYWLVDKAWDSEVDSPLSAFNIVADLEFFLAEYSSRVLTRQQLLDRFRDLVNHVVVDVVVPDAFVVRKLDSAKSSASRFPAYHLPLAV